MSDSISPSLYGIRHSNREFNKQQSWGKNQFNSSFPASLCCYLHSRALESIYLKLDNNLEVLHSTISTQTLYGICPNSNDLFYAFETQFTPYQQFVIGNLPRVDLVTQSRDTGQCLSGLEIKLTALPDNTTCDLPDSQYGCELVVRPDTIVYLACSLAASYRKNIDSLSAIIGTEFHEILDWSQPQAVITYIPRMIDVIDRVSQAMMLHQEPLVMQPIWKTEGKSPKLAHYCLDVFVWSNLAFIRLFLDLAKKERDMQGISRQTRTVIWLFKMLYDFSVNGQINYVSTIDGLSYNTKNDKAFAVSGRVTRQYMKSETLSQPRIKRDEIKEIILGGGHHLLSPERRFDAIIYNSPDLFE